MAALVAGVQYGLSSQGNFHENKSLIFVKLTDSAYRAIEDYLRNKNKTSQQPTIQFLGNEGHLSFPNPSTNGHGSAFNFSLSGNEDIEGPQGSFECLQSKSKSLEFMGALPCKMRIQANDDVYAATKQRMAVAEEQHKKNCTRVIKASGPDIGRKVKVKKVGGIGALPRRETSPPSYRAGGPPLSTASGGASKPRSNFAQSRSEGGSNGSSSHLDNHSASHPNLLINGPSIQPGRNLPGGACGRNGGNQDIMRRPIRERLIHLLALRPFKKPELYDRIKREGLRERDRVTMANVLKQVAYMSDNTYHLIRHVWNDVQEDWPFYSEQDKQVLKRRKPQNLTPPGSDGSSGSGHSPTSTHPGSPPPAIFPAAPSPSGTSPANGRLPGPDPSGVKRPGYYDGADGIITKRQRISHFKRQPTEWSSSSVTTNNNNNNTNNNTQRVRTDSVPRRPPEPPRTGGSPGHHPPRHRHPGSASSPTPVQGRAGRPPKEEGESNVAPGIPSHSPDGGAALSRSSGGGSGYVSGGGSGCVSVSGSVSGGGSRGEEEVEGSSGRVTETSASPSVKDKSQGHAWPGGKSNVRSIPASPEEFVKSQERVSSGAAASGGSRGRGIVTSGADNHEEEAESERASSEYPEYLTEYTTIMTAEQRNKYKEDFNADYSEYRDLHTIVERVSRQFADLKERLRQEEMGSDAWNNIKDQIVREYQKNKRDQHYPEAKKKFQYLHEKLSHIKRLVLEYDSSNAGQVSSVQSQKH